MNRKIACLLGALASFAFAGAAQASTIYSGVWHLTTSTNTSTGWTNYSHSLTTFDGIKPKKNDPIGTFSKPTTLNDGVTLYGKNTYIRNGSKSGQYAAPWMSAPSPKGAADTTNYLSVQAGGEATFDFSGDKTPVHYFGFLWGSIDKYNSISFFGKDGILATYTGADLLKNANGLTGLGGSLYANFTSSIAILKVVLTSCDNAFEIDNVHVSAVPVPAALPLFGAALAGLGVIGRRRKKAALAA